MESKNVRIELENRMFESFSSVSENKNIVFVNRNNMTNEQLAYVVKQYAQFPRNIVSILVGAAYNFGYHGWTELVNELRENVFEELGGGCGDIASEFGPHYSILRRELQNVFDFDIHSVVSSKATAKFLDTVRNIVQSEPLIAAGGVFALEASAVPELGIVMKMVNHLADLKDKPLTKNLQNFFQFHVDDIEVGHRDRLIQLIENHLADTSNFNKFVDGYDKLLNAMDIWWLEIHQESTIINHEKAAIIH